MKTLIDKDSCLVRYYPCWVPIQESYDLLETFKQTLPLVQKHNVFYGKKVKQPRLTSWHADSDQSYTYSGVERESSPWTSELQSVRQRLNALLDTDLNSVLVNYYRDGKDSIGKHSDNEDGLGPSENNVIIASVSYGAPRQFILTRKGGKERIEIGLGCGDLLTMEGKTQQLWQHEIPRTDFPVGERLNLTFRVVI